MGIPVERKPIKFYPNPTRVIARFFKPGNSKRPHSIIQKVFDTPDEVVEMTLNQVLRDFSKRHRNITKIFEKHYIMLQDVFDEMMLDPQAIPLKKRLLIGAYFTSEYSIESAAFFNPSIMEDPDQTNLADGQKRIIVSFRATGEGSISSIVFRRGIIDRDNSLSFEEAGNLVDVPEQVKRHTYEKDKFLKKLDEMGVHKDVIGMVMDRLDATFLYGELQAAIFETIKEIKMSYTKQKVIQAVNWVADSHYEVTFSLDTAISERVIFPVSYAESNGIEDARFVRFVDDDGSVTYYATYTAYDGYTILPKIIETKDFYYFRVLPIHGECAQNKDMALFPRKINGKYVMISRLDGVNNYLMYSDNINLWQTAEKIQEPSYTWEYVQIGNCGSPIETEHGWLLITHGVGPMRTYSLGVTLLGINDPSKIIGQLDEPLLMANEEEREGYVPNVVYSCGSIIHNGELIVPYGLSDSASSFIGVSLEELFRYLINNAKP